MFNKNKIDTDKILNSLDQLNKALVVIWKKDY